MSAPIGGRASKLGDTYERRWAVRFLLMMVAGEVTRVRWEPIQDGQHGIDLEMEFHDGHREGHQLKRQNGSDGEWSVPDLCRERVLQTAKQYISRGSGVRFTFVSSDPVPHLKDLPDRAGQDPESLETFLSQHVRKHQGRIKAYSRALTEWGLVPGTGDAEAFALLKQMDFRHIDRGEDFRRDLVLLAGSRLTGDPESSVALLGEYLDAHLGEWIYADVLLRYLGPKGHTPTDLSRAPALPGAVLTCNSLFQDALRARLIGGTMIARPEAMSLVQKLKSPSPPRLVVVHGRAGIGKSAVLLDVSERLLAAGNPLLATQLHTSPPDGSPFAFGTRALGLPGSPATSLQALAAGRPSVLILDQLDALRLTSVHSYAAWNAGMRVIEEALACPFMTVVLACRTFDLENDPNIHHWIEAATTRFEGAVERLEVRSLDDASVSEAISSLGVDAGLMSERVRSLLRHPNTLALWSSLARRGDVRREFSTATELMRRYLAACRREAATDHGVSEMDAAHVLRTLVQAMESVGALTAAEALVASHVRTVEALCSTGLLVRSDGRLSFAHQSYFDHLVAERVAAEAGSGIDPSLRWVKANQSLFRRDQLRQLLFLMRDQEPALAADLLRALLADGDVRFHLKHLALGVLAEANAPTREEIQIVIDLSEDADWWKQIASRVLWGRPAWFDALEREGVWLRWLEATDEDRLREVLRVIGSVVVERADQIESLLDNRWHAAPPWPERLALVVHFDPSHDSPQMAEFRRRSTRSGAWGAGFISLERMAKRTSERVVPLVEAMLHRSVRRALGKAKKDEQRWELRDETLEKGVIAAVRFNGRDGWSQFRPLLRAIERIEATHRATIESVEDLVKSDFGFRHALDKALQTAEMLVRESVIGLAQTAEGTAAVLATVRSTKSKRLNRAVMTGLVNAPSTCADEILEWLMSCPERFSLGDEFRSLQWAPARDVIAAHSLHCAGPVLKKLEQVVLSYHDRWEKPSFSWRREDHADGRFFPNQWGRAQNVLLGAIDPSRISPEALHRSQQWRAKFGDPALERPSIQMSDVRIRRSVIPPTRVHRVSDREWFRITTGAWESRGSVMGQSVLLRHFGERSHAAFSEMFGEAARREPIRFARLALKLPTSVPREYFASLLYRIGDPKPLPGVADWSPASTREIVSVVRHVGDLADSDVASALCQAIEQRSDEAWPVETIDMLARYAEHLDPVTEEPIARDTEGKSHRLDLEGTRGVRGRVATAVRHLLFEHWDLAPVLLPIADSLLDDPHPAVRYEAIGMCLPVLNHDRDRAGAMLRRGCNTTDVRVLRSGWITDAFPHLRERQPECIEPIIARMVSDQEPKVAEQGARWATALWLQQGRGVEMYRECLRGTPTQRKACAATAMEIWTAEGTSAQESRVRTSGLKKIAAWAGRSILLGFRAITRTEGTTTQKTLQSQSGAILVRAFNDPSAEVRAEAAHVFYFHGAFAHPEAIGVVARFVQSDGFADNANNLLHALADYPGSLLPFRGSILHAADRLAGDLAVQARDYGRRLGTASEDISTLLLRLYEIGYGGSDRRLVETCLDRWDAMLRAQVGVTERHLEAIDA